jgi:hypothetical protein
LTPKTKSQPLKGFAAQSSPAGSDATVPKQSVTGGPVLRGPSPQKSDEALSTSNPARVPLIPPSSPTMLWAAAGAVKNIQRPVASEARIQVARVGRPPSLAVILDTSLRAIPALREPEEGCGGRSATRPLDPLGSASDGRAGYHPKFRPAPPRVPRLSPLLSLGLPCPGQVPAGPGSH